MEKIKAFFIKKGVRPSGKLYFVDAMSSMALGLFATLLISTIFKTIGQYAGSGFFLDLAGYAKDCTGAALGMAIAYALKAPPLVLFSGAVVGAVANNLPTAFDGLEDPLTAGPAGAFVVCIVAVELGKLVSKTTPVDILVTPSVTIVTGMGLAMAVCPAISYAMFCLGNFINTVATRQPLLFGVVIAVVMGMVLTLPISSAAICTMIHISGLAGGAAAAGCCAQMVGFAVISFRENKWGGLAAQGLGTSMLQMGNIVKNPRIWIPATLASAITGPLATVVFGLKCEDLAAGMGTCGLVGPLGMLTATGVNDWRTWVGVLVVCFVAPALLSLLFSAILRKIGWIKDGDLNLDL